MHFGLLGRRLPDDDEVTSETPPLHREVAPT
jgi:hypothetical protein